MKDEVTKYVTDIKSSSSAKSYLSKISDGELLYISIEGNKISLDMNAMVEFVKELAGSLQYDVTLEQKQQEPKKKKKPEDDVQVVTNSHSSRFIKQKNEENSAKKSILVFQNALVYLLQRVLMQSLEDTYSEDFKQEKEFLKVCFVKVICTFVRYNK